MPGVRPTTVLLTGATSGIGLHLARRLATSVDTLIVHGPEPEDAVAGSLQGFRGQRARVHYLRADFSSLDQVTALATHVREVTSGIDLLVNNAGIPGATHRVVTVDGNERTLQVNYLAMILLTVTLRPQLHRGSRIVNVGSGTHRFETLDLDDPNFTHGYSAASAYYRSKFAVVAASLWMAEQLRPDGVDVITACPGLTDTALITAMFGSMGAGVEHGAANLRAAALSAWPTGTYLQDGEIQVPGEQAVDPDIQAAVVRIAAEALGLPGLESGRYLAPARR